MSKNISDSVWDRSGHDDLSKNIFVMMVSLWTAAGIALSAVMAYHTQHVQLTWVHFVGALIVSIMGIFIALGSENPAVSLIGYLMVSGSLGAVMGPAVAQYTQASIVKVFAITTCMVIVLGTIGAIIPQSLESWGSFLSGGLTLLIIGLCIVPIASAFGLPVEGAMTWLDWIGVFIFGAYVIFDLNRAMRVPRTHDNAIDCALAIYLDFINLFLKLLRIMGDED